MALGSQREGAPLDRLVEASAVAGISGVRQSGALMGLAASRNEDAVGVLIDRVRYGAMEPRARAAGARALGTLARMLDKRGRERAVEALSDLLRDPYHVMRAAAAEGLSLARGTEAIGALESYSKTLSAQERVRVDRYIQGLRTGPDEALKKAEKQLEDLRDQLGKLSDRLGKVEAHIGTKDEKADAG